MAIHAQRRRDRERARRARVWLDGIEVTARCFYADARRGVVRCWRLNALGFKFLETAPDGRQRIAVEELRGRVVVRVARRVA